MCKSVCAWGKGVVRAPMSGVRGHAGAVSAALTGKYCPPPHSKQPLTKNDGGRGGGEGADLPPLPVAQTPGHARDNPPAGGWSVRPRQPAPRPRSGRGKCTQLVHHHRPACGAGSAARQARVCEGLGRTAYTHPQRDRGGTPVKPGRRPTRMHHDRDGALDRPSGQRAQKKLLAQSPRR